MEAAIPARAEAYEALRRAHANGRLVIATDKAMLNRPGSPVFNPLDIYVPPVVLLASSLTLLFAFGLVPWILGLVAVLLFQRFVAGHWVEWRMRRRVIEAVLANPNNLDLLWSLGGIVIALKDWPQRNCAAPYGDWRRFVGEYLTETPEQIA